MKKSTEVIILLGFVLWAEFVGAVVYRTLINDNSRKDYGGPESNVFNEKETKNGVASGERNGMIEKGGEEQEVTEMSKDETLVHGGIGQEGCGDKAGTEATLGINGNRDGTTENVSVLIGGKGLCTCTCSAQGEMGQEDDQGGSCGNSGQETQTEESGLVYVTEAHREKDNCDCEAADGKVGVENEEAESEQPGPETSGNCEKVEKAEGATDGAGEHEDIGGEPDLETSTGIDKNGEQDEMDQNEGNGVNVDGQTFRFSPLKR